VRRQTVHQLVQMGLIIPNPDNPSRPVNSPKTRYIIEVNALALLRTYGTEEWEPSLHAYLAKAPSLKALVGEARTMKLIAVRLPHGETVTLTAGGQNLLIKAIVEQFCPRYTPSGTLRYLSDAGKKLRRQEIEFFGRLVSCWTSMAKCLM
jgi:hypothetical protein